jgi:type I restriction enzyme S subunit
VTKKTEMKTAQGPWELPEGWEWTNLREVAKIQSGGTPTRSRSDYYGGDIPWVKISDINGMFVDATEETITEKGLAESSAKLFPEGTILFTIFATIGKVGVLKVEAATNQAIVGIQVRTDDIEPLYLAYFLSHFGKEVSSQGRGMAQNNINQAILRSLPILVPPLPAQRRIVARIESLLAEVKEARALLTEMRRDADRILDAALTEAFENPETETWSNEAPLGKLVEIRARQVDPRQPDYKTLPHIGGEAIESRSGRLGSYQTAEDDGVISGKYLFEPGTILYSKIRPYLRKATVMDFEGLCSADIYPLSVKTDQLLPRFLMWSLIAQPFTTYAIAKSGRARMPKINRADLFAYELAFPDHDEQERIVTHLDAVQSEVDRIRGVLDEEERLLDRLERSILEKAFRGEL